MNHPPSYYAREYEMGQLSYAAFKHMKDAQAYGAASSITWLRSIVRGLENRVNSGNILQIDQGPDGPISISNVEAFLQWIDSNFPDAA